jgi:carboxyl-terminal processing protease
MNQLIQFMMSKKALPIWCGLVAAGVFVAISGWGKGGDPAPNEESKYQRILARVRDILAEGHYSPKKIDDNFSKTVFKKVIDDVDSEKDLFLAADVALLKKYETKIDDELNGGQASFIPEVDKIYQKRMKEVSALYNSILSKPFDFKVDEMQVKDAKQIEFAATETERADRWRKKLKLMALERFVDAQEMREKNKDKKDFVVKADSTLERESREKVLKLMNRSFTRMTEKNKEEDKFNAYVNTITETMDPHTNFFPPVEKRAFDEGMSGTFFGIGAQLREEDGNVKVGAVITGGPAWQDGKLAAGDVFLKVAQSPKDSGVDVNGFATEDVVKLIRGKEGTQVYLTVRSVEGVVKNLVITRKKIVLDETYARSAIVNRNGKKYGLIYLPEFYANFQNLNDARCSRDVANEITKLKEEGIDGLIMDLRNNGGGSLQDVVQMVGFFIKDGPVVQVKNGEGALRVLSDMDKGNVMYDGPLVVMVNEFSASASEIFAAAIQDYKRGIVIGSTSTFGKGTVQSNIPLDRESGLFTGNGELGTIKLTLQKFYRVNGGATQLKGVESDVVVPDQYELLKFREKDTPDALPWDEIAQATYKSWADGQLINNVKRKLQDKVNADSVFQKIKVNSESITRLNEKDFSLQIDKYKSRKKEIIDVVKMQEQLLKLKRENDVVYMTKDEQKFNGPDKEKSERYKAWLKGLRTDLYLDKSLDAVQELISSAAGLVKN